MAGMRRSEVSALRWADVVDSTEGDGMLVTVRRSKINPEGEVNDVRFVKDGVARALQTLRDATSPVAVRVFPMRSTLGESATRTPCAGPGAVKAAQFTQRRQPRHRGHFLSRTGARAK